MTTPKPYRHPAFPPPTSPDVVLWRYLDAWKFEWLVREKRLFMTRADQLGDPLEGTAPAGHAQWWRDQIANASSDHERATISHKEQFLSRLSRQFRDGYYVSCWHANPDETPRMWDEYTTSPESVAIRTTYALLKESVPDLTELGLVRYIDYSTADLPSMNLFERITHKDAGRFSFEQELRAVALRPFVPELGQAEFDAAHFEVEADPSVTVFAPVIEPAKLIEGVVLHPRAPNAFKARMSAFCAEAGLPAPIASRTVP